MQKQIDILDIWHAMLKQWQLIAVVAGSITVFAAAWALLAKPIYRAEILIAPVETGSAESSLGGLVGQFSGLASLAGLDLKSNQSKEEALAVLASRRFTEAFVESNNLMPLLFAEKWDAKKAGWSVDDAEDVPTIEDAHNLLNKKIREIAENPETGLVRISIDWYDRELAASWANMMVHHVNDDLRKSAISEAERSIDYLTKELEKTSIVGVQQAIFSLIESQVNVAMLANVREEYVFKVIDPAVPPDADRYIWPQRLLMIVVGFVVGLMIGSLIALIRSGRVLEADEYSDDVPTIQS